MRFHLPILLYHRIGQPEKGIGLSGLYVPLHEFMWQMAYLSQAGYHSLSVDEFLSILHGEKPPFRQGILITFDDGSKSVLHSAYPVLKRYGFTALVPLATNHVGGKSEWATKKEERSDPILSWDEVAYLKNEGIGFASHTLSHSHLPKMDDDQLRQELRMSRSVLEAKIDHPITAFAYPFNSYNQRVIKLVREAGYQCAFSTYTGNRHCASDAYQLRRLTILPNLNLQRFKQCLSPLYDWEHRPVHAAGNLLRRMGLRE